MVLPRRAQTPLVRRKSAPLGDKFACSDLQDAIRRLFAVLERERKEKQETARVAPQSAHHLLSEDQLRDAAYHEVIAHVRTRCLFYTFIAHACSQVNELCDVLLRFNQSATQTAVPAKPKTRNNSNFSSALIV